MLRIVAESKLNIASTSKHQGMMKLTNQPIQSDHINDNGLATTDTFTIFYTKQLNPGSTQLNDNGNKSPDSFPVYAYTQSPPIKTIQPALEKPKRRQRQR